MVTIAGSCYKQTRSFLVGFNIPRVDTIATHPTYGEQLQQQTDVDNDLRSPRTVLQ